VFSRYLDLADAALKDPMPITCSQCGVEKRETNHWFFGWLERNGQRLCLVPWGFDPHLANEQDVQKLCGDQCAHKFLQHFTEFLKASST